MTTAEGGHVAEDLAALGPFFAVSAHQPDGVPRPPWRRVSELAEQPGALSRRIATVRAVLAAAGGRPPGEIDAKAAASAVHLGIVSRLVAFALGAAVLRCDAGICLDELWWQAAASGPVPLSVPEPALVPVPGDGVVVTGQWAEHVVEDVVAPLTEASSRVAALSGRVLWGNAASGINAAAGQVARSRPDLAGIAWEAARALFASPRLIREGQPPGVTFRRSSCCLFYRLAPGTQPARSAICGDCVLGARR